LELTVSSPVRTVTSLSTRKTASEKKASKLCRNFGTAWFVNQQSKINNQKLKIGHCKSAIENQQSAMSTGV